MKKRAVVAIVNYRGKVLVGKKRKDSKKFLAGKWHLPAENVEGGESDEAALIRGLREEASIDIKVGKYVGEDTTPSGKEARWYECFALSVGAIPGSDLDALAWVPRREVPAFIGKRTVSWPDWVKKYFE